MTKKAYLKPVLNIVKIQHRHHILSCSAIETQGLGNSQPLEYDDSGDDMIDAW